MLCSRLFLFVIFKGPPKFPMAPQSSPHGFTRPPLWPPTGKVHPSRFVRILRWALKFAIGFSFGINFGVALRFALRLAKCFFPDTMYLSSLLRWSSASMATSFHQGPCHQLPTASSRHSSSRCSSGHSSSGMSGRIGRSSSGRRSSGMSINFQLARLSAVFNVGWYTGIPWRIAVVLYYIIKRRLLR